VHVETRAQYAQLERARLAILDTSAQKPPIVYDFQITSLWPSGASGFQLNLTSDQQSEAIAALSDLGKNAGVVLTAQFSSSPFLDIQSVRISRADHPGNPNCPSLLAGESLRSKFLHVQPRLMRIILPQEQVSDVVLLTNEVLGALMIGALLLALLWLSWQWANALYRLYLVSDDEIRAQAKKSFEAKPLVFAAESPADLVIGNFELMHRRLSFVRVLGPAVGFLLTVSSLIAGLHPSQQDVQNSFHFISSLQIALVATFIGLLTRIVAEFSIRVHQSAAERVLMLVSRG